MHAGSCVCTIDITCYVEYIRGILITGVDCDAREYVGRRVADGGRKAWLVNPVEVGWCGLLVILQFRTFGPSSELPPIFVKKGLAPDGIDAEGGGNGYDKGSGSELHNGSSRVDRNEFQVDVLQQTNALVQRCCLSRFWMLDRTWD